VHFVLDARWDPNGTLRRHHEARLIRDYRHDACDPVQELRSRVAVPGIYEPVRVLVRQRPNRARDLLIVNAPSAAFSRVVQHDVPFYCKAGDRFRH
jgi:hypothetical protein